MNFEQMHNKYLEPPEARVWGEDWQGNTIYEYEARDYYEVDGTYVSEDDIVEWFTAHFSKVEVD